MLALDISHTANYILFILELGKIIKLASTPNYMYFVRLEKKFFVSLVF